ncbi:MAG: hypothetical protein ACK469_10035, partial [Bacteroidota bacterium]
MKRNLILFFCFLISFSCQDKITAIPKDPQPPLTGILSALKKEHPRLMLTNSLVEEIKLKRKNDAVLDK